MKIKIKIDTDLQTVVPSADSDTAALAHYLMEQMPSDLGRYFGLLAKKLNQPAEIVSNNTLLFPQQAMQSYGEESMT